MAAKYEDHYKHWDRRHGWTMREAMEKKMKVEDGYGIGKPTSQWSHVEILPDERRVDGFKVRVFHKTA